MAEFINTVDVLGDKALTNSIIDGSITEIADNFVKDIGDFALRGCAALISANFVEATSIGGMAFYGCTKLTTADFPAATSIGNSAFYDCSALNKVNFPVATSIGNGTFNGCYNLATADFPAVKTIDNTAFMYCSRLTALILRSGTLATLGGVNVLEGTPIEKGKGYIYVPSALLESYKADSKWSTYANQFRKLEDYTVDGTVTGEVDPNRHMVRFFNDDGTFLGYKVVPHGGTATYDGTPVCSEDSSWAFKGFEPEPTNVTADMDCYAKYQEPISFASASWAKIAEISEAGNAKDYFAIGDTKAITLTDGKTCVVEIVGFNHDTLAADTSKKAGISVLCIRLPNITVAHTIFFSSYKKGETYGWAGPNHQYVDRSWYNDTLYNTLLPYEIRSVIKPVNKGYVKITGTSTSSPSLSAATAVDYCWPASGHELGWSNFEGNMFNAFVKVKESETYERFKEGLQFTNHTDYTKKFPLVVIDSNNAFPEYLICHRSGTWHATRTFINNGNLSSSASYETRNCNPRFGFCI